jgi:predicted DNA-binding transcriptional regulator AlpA
MHNEAQTEAIWYSDKDLAARYGVSRTSIWRWHRSGNFPKPRKFSARVSRWPASEIEEFDRQRLEGEG